MSSTKQGAPKRRIPKFKYLQPAPPGSPIYRGGFRLGVIVLGKRPATPSADLVQSAAAEPTTEQYSANERRRIEEGNARRVHSENQADGGRTGFADLPQRIDDDVRSRVATQGRTRIERQRCKKSQGNQEMTNRKATPEETGSWLGKGLIVPGPQPQPTSSGPSQPLPAPNPTTENSTDKMRGGIVSKTEGAALSGRPLGAG